MPNRATIIVLAVLVGLGTFSGCGPGNSCRPVLQDLVGRSFGLPHSLLPPIYSFCGTVQPGFDDSDPQHPTLNGEPYDPLQDPFCTLTYTRRFSAEGDTVYMDDDIYVVEMGEPDPEAELRPWMVEGGHYCSFRYAIEANVEGSDADAWSQCDVQFLTETVVDVPPPCDVVGYLPGTPHHEYVYRTTRDDVFFFLPPDFEYWAGGDLLFRGYAGVLDTGGAMALPPPEPAGTMTYYEECEPEPAAEGPGYCPLPDDACRLFSESAEGLPVCSWADVHALPSVHELVDPAWQLDHPNFYSEAYGGR